VGVEKSRGRRSYPGPVDKSIGENCREVGREKHRQLTLRRTKHERGAAALARTSTARPLAIAETTRDHLTHVKDLDRFTGLYPIYLRLI